MPAATQVARLRRAAVWLIAAGFVVTGATSCGATRDERASEYCAILPDTIGLYTGNQVTQMGYRVGTIKTITPSAKSVRVDFTVTDGRPMPQDVKAVIRSMSVLADRSLELVGNYRGGPKLAAGECVPLARSVTPKSLSTVIASANTFFTGINPKGSTNVGDVVSQLDKAAGNSGAGLNEILTTSSRLLDNPDQQINDLSSVVTNLAALSTTLVELRDPFKQILNDSVTTTPYVRDIVKASASFQEPQGPLFNMLSDLETRGGDELQLTLDTISDVLRINSPHMPGWLSLMGGILKPLPWWINTAANHFNNREFHMSYRPPLYRIRTPNGPIVCGVMNASMPGSCANVAGQPYGVDINLLQYVFMNAGK